MGGTTEVATVVLSPRVAMGRLLKSNFVVGILFVSPWLVGFLGFVLYPFISSLFFSFTSYNIVSSPVWIGLRNYQQLLSDSLFWRTLYNTFYYTLLSVPLSTLFGICLALLLNVKVKGVGIYRTVFYLPTVVPAVASSILWIWLFNPQFGLIDAALYVLHIPGPEWLVDPRWSKLALVLMSLWNVGGAVVIYLAGLQDVPQELIESAHLDGANWYQRIIHITIPMITPVIFFNVIMGLIGSFQYFTQAFVMTGGGPDNSTLFYSLYLYKNAFQYLRMGYASAMAWILFLIILLCTLVVFKSSGKWVFYGGESR